MMEDKGEMVALCECNSSCTRTTRIPFRDNYLIKREGYIVIVDGCEHGPEPTDILVEKRNGYSLYRDPFGI